MLTENETLKACVQNCLESLWPNFSTTLLDTEKLQLLMAAESVAQNCLKSLGNTAPEDWRENKKVPILHLLQTCRKNLFKIIYDT